MKNLKIAALLLALPVLGLGQTLNLTELSQEFTETKLTLQIGFDYSLFGIALVNKASQPVVLLGTNILGITARFTLNIPESWEIQEMAQQILQDFPQLTESQLKKRIKNQFLSSKIFTFIEGGIMMLPLGYYWLTIPFIGFGWYIPLGATQSFLVVHLNLPLIGGIGIIYIF